MLGLLVHQPLFAIAFTALATLVVVLALGLRVIHENESGLVIKRFGRPLAAGRLIATDGEAGYQAAMLPPGWHFPLWRFQYRIERVPLVLIPAGELACVVAANEAGANPIIVSGLGTPTDQRRLALAQRLGAKRGILTHMTSDLDYDTLCRELPPHVEPAFDGMVVEI